jgi:hypothetical protein
MGKDRGQINYTAIGEQLSSGKELDDKFLGALFSIGLEYASGLIKDKNLYLLGQQADDFKKYFTVAVFGRLVGMYDKAIMDGTTKSESVSLFEKLRDVVCTRLSIPKELLPGDRLSSLFNKSLDPFYERELSPAISASMELVGKLASEVIPNNLPKAVGIDSFILD